MSTIIKLAEKSSNAYEPSEFSACVVARIVIIGIIAAIIAAITISVGITQFSQEETILTEEYVATFDFEGDELGNYEKWCLENNGDWLKDYDCGFKDSKDHKKARHSLDELVNVSIRGNAAKDLCEFLQLGDCDEISISAEFDMRKGYVVTENSVDGKNYEFRVNGDVIEYRPNTFEEANSFPWTQLE